MSVTRRGFWTSSLPFSLFVIDSFSRVVSTQKKTHPNLFLVWKNLRLRYRFKLYCRPVRIVPFAHEALQFVLLTYLCRTLMFNKNQGKSERDASR